MILGLPTLREQGFKSKKIRVNINMPIKSEAKAESADVMKHVDEDRKLLIQVSLMRLPPRSASS